MKCLNPVTLQTVSPRYPRGLTVPCGKCLQCRIQKRREWSLRMLHELDVWDKAVFLTLTYNDVSLPYNGPYMLSGPGDKYQYKSPIGPVLDCWPSLCKEDLQKFWKRLRKNHGSKTIKYFACGEYGDSTQRPHYHAIIYGLGFSRDDRNTIMACWPFCDWHQKTIAEKSFGIVQPESIQYVAQYIDKKYSGDLAVEEYYARAREPTFRVGSQGLGLNYIDKNKETMVQNGYVTQSGNKRSIPRYYLNKLSEMGLKPDTTDSQIEAQIQRNEAITGLSYTDRDLLLIPRPDIRETINLAMDDSRKQRGLNLAAKIAQRKKAL